MAFEPPAARWYAALAMPLPTPRRNALSLPLLGGICGVLLGLTAFAIAAALWRAGATHLAGLTGEATLLLVLAGVAAAILSAQSARIKRSRVPIGRALPHAWWPPQHDPVPVVAACVGAPIAAAALAAMWLFH